MEIIKSLSSRTYTIAVTIVTLCGIGIIITAGFLETLPLQITMGLGGLGLVCLGIIVVKLVYDERKSLEKLDALMKKLEELQETQQESGKDKSGIAIADVISSSLKFYADYQEKNKNEE